MATSLAMLAGVGACGSSNSSSQEDGNTLTVWWYADEGSAESKGWNQTIKVFEKKTGKKVKFERKSFEQIAKNGSQFLNSDKAPDVMESNRGNSSAGLLVTQNLLSDLGPYVKKYGWDKIVKGQNQILGKYTSKGVIGGNTWYGIPTYAEMQRVYYNDDLFAKYNIPIPNTFDEFVSALAKFKENGITPLSEAAMEYPLQQLWWQLVLSKADKKFVEDYQLYKGKVDWNSEPFTFATNTIEAWLKAGYISKDVSGLKSEDAFTGFTNGTHPIFVTGTWNHGRFMDEAKNFKWESKEWPGANVYEGGTGNILTIPRNAKHKDMAAQFINCALQPDIQNFIGNAGGIPLTYDPSAIKDPSLKVMIDDFKKVASKGVLGYYPDWAGANMYDSMSSSLQQFVNGEITGKQMLDAYKGYYDQGVKDLGILD
ncbi:ABC transporter substrate-binding protein [Bifidobacterium sp. ESL0775]|uniref:ABC transporter substrate-binding protein n=1 Tax=Bifidobacterium sp. ESL0775 TaxID=2983230 RepID=UPI0023F94D82|nr:ABC transporter substrate-binding protein [Bifidobacterium sp. ESL0775]WEV68551.1 ABC transporter substrate-binding protein [Bifidobacterium sp. ESL0775]